MIASLCRRRRRRSSVPASSLLGARPSDSGMRYTSNDAPRGITSIAARHGATGVYMRVRLRASYARAGRVAGQPADQRRVTFTRSCSLLLARGRPLDAPLPSPEAPSRPCSPRWRGRSIVGVAPSPSSSRPPRSNLNYHFTLPFERAAAAATAETQAADSPVYLSSAPFSLCFFFFLSLSVFLPLSLSLYLSIYLPVQWKTLVLEIDEVAHWARARAGRERRAF